MRKRRERVWFISKHLCFPCFENINVLEALAKQRCVPIGKQNVYQWSASLLESKRAFSCVARSIWNSLPGTARLAPTLSSFRLSVYREIFARTYSG